MELHHPIMSKLWDLGGQTKIKKVRKKGRTVFKSGTNPEQEQIWNGFIGYQYYMLSRRWCDMHPNQVLANHPKDIKSLYMFTFTLEDAKGLSSEEDGYSGDFDFNLEADKIPSDSPVSRFSGWFMVNFKSCTDDVGVRHTPCNKNPAHLSTPPEEGYIHWGKQAFNLPSAIPLIYGETTNLREYWK